MAYRHAFDRHQRGYAWAQDRLCISVTYSATTSGPVDVLFSVNCPAEDTFLILLDGVDLRRVA